MVNLLSRYPDANIYGYPTDRDIIKLALLVIYFKFITTAHLNIVASAYISDISINLNIVSNHKITLTYNIPVYFKLLEIISY